MLLRSLIYLLIGIILSSFFLMSCSYFSTEREPVSDKQTKDNMKMVSKVQYDELVRRYEQLQKKYQDMKVTQNTESPLNELQQSNWEEPQKNPTQVDSASNSVSNTVDVFADAEKKRFGGQSDKTQAIASYDDDNNTGASPSVVVDGDKLERDIVALRRAINYLENSNDSEAVKILKQLENSPYQQIKVRAKFHLGNLLFKQREYDLALQVFEEVITKYAFSGLVIDALKNAVKCCEQLNLHEKRARYHSILTDFFGIS